MVSKVDIPVQARRCTAARPPKSPRLGICWAVGSAIALATGAMLAPPEAGESYSVGSGVTATANPDTANADIGADIKPARASVAARRVGPPPSAKASPKLLFGYIEFDWDPDAPGGVPGFGPLPNSASQMVTFAFVQAARLLPTDWRS